jgi:hypothetical protein
MASTTLPSTVPATDRSSPVRGLDHTGRPYQDRAVLQGAVGWRAPDAAQRLTA